MLSSQVEEMRNAATTYRMLGRHTLANVLLEAAESITELRGALSVASVDYRHLSEENAKLRELVSDLMPIVCDGCHERLCDMPKEEHPFVECLFDCRMRELGIEVNR